MFTARTQWFLTAHSSRQARVFEDANSTLDQPLEHDQVWVKSGANSRVWLKIKDTCDGKFKTACKTQNAQLILSSSVLASTCGQLKCFVGLKCSVKNAGLTMTIDCSSLQS